MTAPVSQVLSEAADLLEKPGAWTQGAYARDAQGEFLGTGTDPDAVCFCALGAIEHVDGFRTSAGRFLAEMLRPEGYRSVTAAVGSFNDATDRTQAEVVDALRRAAALAKEQGR